MSSLSTCRQAIDEIQNESTKKTVRPKWSVPDAGQRVPHLDQCNKRLLQNTIRSAIAHNRRQDDPMCGRIKRKTETELDAIIAGGKRRQPKFGQRIHCFRKVQKSKEPDKTLTNK